MSGNTHVRCEWGEKQEITSNVYLSTSQDLQYAIIGKVIAASEGRDKIFLVGDPDQAIFKSLGGLVKTTAEISNDIGGYNVKKLSLNNNYRSTQRIIDLYSNFQNTNLTIKSLAEYRNHSGIVILDKNISKDDLVNRITEIIENEISNGVPLNEICILAPQWSFLIPIARKLKKNLPNIDFDTPGLTLLPSNRENFWFKLARIILITNEPSKYFLSIKWIKIFLEELANLSGIAIETDSDNCRNLFKKINSINLQTEDAMEYLKESFIYVFEKLRVDYTLNKVLIEHWDNFFNVLKKRYEDPEFNNIPKDIEYMKKVFTSKKGIVINTCQGIKGEEFHTVIAFGLLKGYLPHWNEIRNSNDRGITESNKLLYVICSRAKKNLFLFAEKGRMTKKKWPYQITPQLSNVKFKFDSTISNQKNNS